MEAFYNWTQEYVKKREYAMYKMDGRIRYSESDATGTLKLASMVDYLQDCCIFHSADVGYGVDTMNELGCAWLVISWQICINDLPKLAEEIEVLTNPYKFDKFFGYRNFSLRGKDGHEYVRANSVWALIDMKKGRPARAPQEMIDAYNIEKQWEMDYAPRKIDMQSVEEHLDTKDGSSGWMDMPQFPVGAQHLDTNNHVNNGAYVHMAEAYLPADYVISQIRVEYRTQAKLGNMICPRVAVTKDKLCIVDLRDTEGNTYAIVEFAMKNQQ